MGTNDPCTLAGTVQRILNHFMRHCMGKQNHEIRFSDAIAHSILKFAENLRLTAVPGTEITVLPLHALISADDHYTHFFLLRFRAALLLK